MLAQLRLAPLTKVENDMIIGDSPDSNENCITLLFRFHPAFLAPTTSAPALLFTPRWGLQRRAAPSLSGVCSSAPGKSAFRGRIEFWQRSSWA
jgi:hypothetical protein